MERLGTTKAKHGWPLVRLGDVCIVQRGVRVTRKELNADGKYDVYQNSLKPLGKYDSFNCPANNPFMIMALAAGEVGYSESPFWAADDCTYFKELKNLDSKYLYFVLLQNREELRRYVRQATIPRLANKFLECLEIPLPPLSIQHEIVARLEKELTEADSLATNFKRIAELADAEFKAELDETFDAAEGQKVRLGDVFDFIDYRGKTPTKTLSGIPLITAKNVRQGYLDYQEEFFISEAEFTTRQTRGIARKGDILFTTEAPLGFAALADKDVFSTGQRIITFQWKDEKRGGINKYFLYCLTSEWFQALLRAQATGATAQGIKASRLVSLPVLYVPIEQQHAIVARLDAAKVHSNQLKEAALKGLRAAAALRTAILSEAFAP